MKHTFWEYIKFVALAPDLLMLLENHLFGDLFKNEIHEN